MRILLVSGVLIAALIVGGCGDDEGDGGGGEETQAPTGGAGSEVDVTLEEFAIALSPASTEAGSVTFNVENIGPDDVHEFVLVKTDLEPTDLPTLDDGSVDETGEGIEVIDEIEDLAVDASETLTVDLEAGSYVIICNIYDETEDEAHYEEGMRTAFTVE
jgi:uncharacterized cupredoxin-like copper-binding protein